MNAAARKAEGDPVVSVFVARLTGTASLSAAQAA